MTRLKDFPLEAAWPLLLKDLGVRPADVLRRAALPEDLFSRSGVSLASAEYFRLWQAVADEVDDPAFPIHAAQMVSTEAFFPPIFAALCSPNLAVAASRLAHYKRLVAPMVMHIDELPDSFTIALEWLDRTVVPPPSLVAAELSFLIQLPRIATRERLIPLGVEAPSPPEPAAEYERFFGVSVRKGKAHAVVFSSEDARRPFLTVNDAMWEAFEPMLRKKLAELDGSATTADRVRAALLEALPGGSSSMEEISRRLALSKRTLQRRLQNEGTSFQAVLNKTREDLAKHYLSNTTFSGAEISYLLGYDDPNSFFRAFHDWTGETTEHARATLVH